MQSYLNGFHTGDPDLAPVDGPIERATDEVDVLVVGTGPAGAVLTAQLSAFPGIRTRVIERRGGPLELGQADGVACRSMEMFDAFGFSHHMLREAYWVNETVFWRPAGDDKSRIERSGRVQDVEDGLSEFPHVILNQARVQHFLLEAARKSPTRLEPDYGVELVSLEVGDGEYPVRAVVRGADGAEQTVRAKYAVGCDGARSTVRQQIGRELRGDSANQAWGVMDVLAVTDFPDVRFKNVIQSSDAGNMIIIPREGGYLVRLYVEMDELQPGERVAARQITFDDVLAQARRILHPHTFEVKEVVWWSVYEIGQRLTDKFDDVPDDAPETRTPRVFVAGDACHTHSPKAGQGMNVSMQDAFNLGWKLASVLEGRSPESLLHTYSAERQAVAQQLIDFDKEWARMMSRPPASPENPDGVTPEVLQSYFQKQGRYTAGVATAYEPALLTGAHTWQHLAPGFGIGERFHSVPVLRVGDAKPMELGHVAQADGRWRLYAFADGADPRAADSGLRALLEWLGTDAASPVVRFTPADADRDAVFDVRAVLQTSLHDIDVFQLPEILAPRKGKYGLVDFEKAFTVDPRQADAYELRGVDKGAGALVVVRPDQYVAHVLPLGARDEVAAFFEGFLLPQR